jgi:hypothetical protein
MPPLMQLVPQRGSNKNSPLTIQTDIHICAGTTIGSIYHMIYHNYKKFKQIRRKYGLNTIKNHPKQRDLFGHLARTWQLGDKVSLAKAAALLYTTTPSPRLPFHVTRHE